MSEDCALLNITKELLANRKATISYKDIAKVTGIEESWLKTFASRKEIKHPSVVRIEKLYNFLSGNELAKLVA